jgi:hypothetical protein
MSLALPCDYEHPAIETCSIQSEVRHHSSLFTFGYKVHRRPDELKMADLFIEYVFINSILLAYKPKIKLQQFFLYVD